jgi:hypothetical protein
LGASLFEHRRALPGDAPFLFLPNREEFQASATEGGGWTSQFKGSPQ